MNDMIEPGTALATIEATNFALVFVPGGVEKIVTNIEREARAQAAALDATKPTGRAALRSLRLKVARSKTTIDEAGKTLKAEWAAKIAPIDSDRREARERLDALSAEIVRPAEEYDAMMKARVENHESALQEIVNVGNHDCQLMPSSEIGLLIDGLSDLHAGRQWEEFAAKVNVVRQRAVDTLRAAYTQAKTREDEAQAEAARRTEEAERDRVALVLAQQAREERIATEAAEAARVAAEQRAAREAREVEERAQAALQAAEALRVHQAAEAERRQREATEALARAERDRLAAEQRAEQERLAAKDRELAAAQMAEATRLAAEQKAKAETEAAIEAERARVAREAAAQRVADERRAADTAHRGKINREALAAILLVMRDREDMTPETKSDLGRKIVEAIAKGQVTHVTIGY